MAEFNPSDRIMRFIDFARFCTNHGIDPLDAGELIALAERAFKAGERSCNSGSERDSQAEQRTGERFENKAKSLGFAVTWPGLWPRLTKDGRDIYLPPLKG